MKEKENNNLLQELNNARHFEEGVFAIKEKDYINEIQSKENIIKEIKSEFNPLHEKIDEQKDRLSYKDDVIKKYANTNKELNEKITKSIAEDIYIEEAYFILTDFINN